MTALKKDNGTPTAGPGVGDVHQTGSKWGFGQAWKQKKSAKKASGKRIDSMVACEATVMTKSRVPICKVDEDQQIVYGWASVIEEGGKVVQDYQGHIITEPELVRAARDFMANYRQGKVMHAGDAKGGIVESIVFTKDLQAALGIDLGKVGWFIGYHVEDKDVWQSVKDGTYSAFSIGGEGVLSDLPEEE